MVNEEGWGEEKGGEDEEGTDRRTDRTPAVSPLLGAFVVAHPPQKIFTLTPDCSVALLGTCPSMPLSHRHTFYSFLPIPPSPLSLSPTASLLLLCAPVCLDHTR